MPCQLNSHLQVSAKSRHEIDADCTPTGEKKPRCQSVCVSSNYTCLRMCSLACSTHRSERNDKSKRRAAAAPVVTGKPQKSCPREDEKEQLNEYVCVYFDMANKAFRDPTVSAFWHNVRAIGHEICGFCCSNLILSDRHLNRSLSSRQLNDQNCTIKKPTRDGGNWHPTSPVRERLIFSSWS